MSRDLAGLQRHIAARMRAGLCRAESVSVSAGDAATAAVDLRAMVVEIFAAVDGHELLVLESPVLGDIYGFAASVNKTVKPDHPARLPTDRNLPADVFLERLRVVLPQFAARRSQLLAALDAAYPTT